MRKDKSGRGWIVVASCFCMGFIMDGVTYSYGLLFIEFEREFKQSKTTTAWISAIFYGWFMFGPVVSILTNRFGCGPVIVCGGAISSIGFLCSVFSTSVQFLYLSYGCVAGFGFSLLNIPKDVVIIQYFEKRRAFAMGISVCGSGIGTIVFGPLTKWLVDEFGWRGTLLIETGLMLNCVACGLVMKPFVANTNTGTCEQMTADPRDSHPHASRDYTEEDMCLNNVSLETKGALLYPKTEDNADVLKHKEHLNGVSPPRAEKYTRILNLRLLQQPKFIIYMVTCLFEGMSFYVPFIFLPDMAVHKGWSREKAAWLLTVIGIVNTVCRIPLGLMADMKSVNRTFMLAVTFCTMGIGSAVMPFVELFEVMVFVCVLFGFTIASHVVISQLVVADLFGENNATDIYGYAYLIFGIGCLISGPVSGGLFDATDEFKLTFATAGIGEVITGVLTFVLFVLYRGQVV